MAMDQRENDDGAHNRRSRRSLVLLAAKVRTPDSVIDVRLRNLSQNGALLETAKPPAIGTEIVFERGDTVAKARVVWVASCRFGIEFLLPILESEVLVHVGRSSAAPSMLSPPSMKRPGLRPIAPPTLAEQTFGRAWVNPGDRGRLD